MKIAVVRGAFLNRYEMQFYEPLAREFDMTAFSSKKPFHDRLEFPVVKLPCPMDMPDFPYKMPILNRLFTDAHYLFGLENALRGYDIVHTAETYFRYTQQCLDAKRKGYVKKVVATVLENIPFNNEGIRGRAAFKARARKDLDLIIALTKRSKAALILEGADERKIIVIPHFIDTGRFQPGKKSKKTSDSSVTILFAGRLERYKGIYELVDAFRLILNEVDDAGSIKLVMAGSGSEKQNLIRRIGRLGLTGLIEFTHVPYDDMPGLYASSDIYVAPSKATETWQEQYNTTLLEAQASGLPIVTTMSGGIPENVGDAAFLAAPGDVLSLKEALVRFILNPELRNVYGKRARNRALTAHDASKGAGMLREAYRSLVP